MHASSGSQTDPTNTQIRIAAATVVSKLDLLSASDFSLDELEGELKRIRADQPVFPLSARTGEGLDAWVDWVVKSARELR